MVKTIEQINREFFLSWSMNEEPLDPEKASRKQWPEVISSVKIAVNGQIERLKSLVRKKETAESVAETDSVAEIDPAAKEEDPKSRTAQRISNIIFNFAIAFLLITVLVFSGGANGGPSLFGFSLFTVLTDSMQSEIPTGSLVITQRVKPDKIQVGNDISYVRMDNAIITHRVIGIKENYDGSGMRGFETKGIENTDPDPDIVLASNVIGKVRTSIPELGFFMEYMSNNITMVFVLFIVLVIVSISIRMFFKAIRGKFEYGGDNAEE